MPFKFLHIDDNGCGWVVTQDPHNSRPNQPCYSRLRLGHVFLWAHARQWAHLLGCSFIVRRKQ